MDIQDLLAKAFDIGNKITFTVKKFFGKELTETSVLTYTQLGIFLNTNHKNIESVEIHLKGAE